MGVVSKIFKNQFLLTFLSLRKIPSTVTSAPLPSAIKMMIIIIKILLLHVLLYLSFLFNGILKLFNLCPQFINCSRWLINHMTHHTSSRLPWFLTWANSFVYSSKVSRSLEFSTVRSCIFMSFCCWVTADSRRGMGSRKRCGQMGVANQVIVQYIIHVKRDANLSCACHIPGISMNFL